MILHRDDYNRIRALLSRAGTACVRDDTQGAIALVIDALQAMLNSATIEDDE